MTLSSQSPRPMASRKYMVSPKRRGRRWPWLVVLALAVGLMVWFRPWANASPRAVDAAGSDAEPTLARAAGSTAGLTTDRPDARGGGDMAGDADVDTDRRVGGPPPRTLTLTTRGAIDNAAAPPAEPTVTSPRPSNADGLSTAATRRPLVDADTAAAFQRGRDLIAERRFVEGRRVLSKLLFNPTARLSAPDAQAIRDMLASVNQALVFGDEVHPGDPVAEYYLVQSGDLLARIAPQYKVPFQFLERINDVDARRLQAGKPIKVIKGPFHARVSKRDYRMDVFLRAPDGSPLYVKSYPVGIGADDSTPTGLWRIEPGKKVKNPDWRNPRTGEYYSRDDPDNPIGEYWMALEGIDEDTRGVRGYGIHGTVDPGSIGDAASMGCIRLRDADIDELFTMFAGGETTVEIVR